MSLKSAGVSHTGLIGTKLPLGIWCTVETYGLRDLMFEELSREIWFVKRTRGNVCWTIRGPKPPHPFYAHDWSFPLATVLRPLTMEEAVHQDFHWDKALANRRERKYVS